MTLRKDNSFGPKARMSKRKVGATSTLGGRTAADTGRVSRPRPGAWPTEGPPGARMGPVSSGVYPGLSVHAAAVSQVPLSVFSLSRISALSVRSDFKAVSSCAICTFSCCSFTFHCSSWAAPKALQDTRTREAAQKAASAGNTREERLVAQGPLSSGLRN